MLKNPFFSRQNWPELTGKIFYSVFLSSLAFNFANDFISEIELMQIELENFLKLHITLPFFQ